MFSDALRPPQPPPAIDSGVKRTTTPGGIDVVTVDRNSAHSSAVVAFRAGSRFETVATAGASAHLSKLLYHANASGKTNVSVTRDLLLSTSNRFAHASRETLTYGAEFSRDQTHSVVEQLAAIAQPLARPWEVEDTRSHVEHDSAQEDDGTGDHAPVLRDASDWRARARATVSFIIDNAHWVAFRSQALGKAPNPLEASADADALHAFRAQFVTRANSVVVGVAVDHDAFVAAADRAFGALPAGTRATPAAATRYVGGETHVEGSDDPLLLLALPSGALGTPAGHAAALLGEVLGRTPDRFTTKPRPGHGLTSRLNRRLGGQGAVVFADAFVRAYSDAGLFGVVVKTLAGHEKAIMQALAAELGSLARAPLADAELLGAKLRLKHSVLAATESAADRARFYAQQALFGSRVLCRNDWVAQIDSLSSADVQAAARAMLAAPPTFLSEGNSSDVTLADITSKF